MTWEDFKKLIDKTLKERKLDGSVIQIGYIDISRPEELQLDVTVEYDQLCIF